MHEEERKNTIIVMQKTPHGGGTVIAAAILKMFARSLMHTQNHPYSTYLPFTRVCKPLATVSLTPVGE